MTDEPIDEIEVDDFGVFLEQLERQKKVIAIIKTGDQLCWECDSSGNWDKLDQALRLLDVENTKAEYLMAWLKITINGRFHVPYWYELRDKVTAKIESNPGSYNGNFNYIKQTQ